MVDDSSLRGKERRWITWSDATGTAQGHLDFTAAADGKRYRLSSSGSGASDRYTTKNGGIDISEPRLEGRMFLLTVAGTRQRGAAWIAAEHHGE